MNTKYISSVAVAATLLLSSTAAFAAPALGSQDWTATITNSPAFCNIASPTVDAVLEYQPSNGNLTLVSAGEVSFDTNGIFAISATTDGILKVNGVPYTNPAEADGFGGAVDGNGIQWTSWQSMTTNLDTTITGSSNASTRTMSWVLTGNEAAVTIAPGGLIQPPASLSFRNGDIVTLSWVISCGA